MTALLLPDNADRDDDARHAIWTAILVASETVRARFRIGTIRIGSGSELRGDSAPPKIPTWKLVEALSLLGVILRSEDAFALEIDLFGKTGPIELVEDGMMRHLWAQHRFRGDRSLLFGCPDIVVTTSPEPPSPSNAIRVIEAKCLRHLGAQVVRSEFGKAHDLRVGTYHIWSFYKPSARAIEGARGLGLDLQALGFDTDRRADLLADPQALISLVAHAQEETRREARFALSLQAAGEEARNKVLGQSP